MMRSRWVVRRTGLLLVVVLVGGCAVGTGPSTALRDQTVAQRRLALLRLDLSVPGSQQRLVDALADEDLLVRRTAARQLAAAPVAPDVLAITIDNDDVLVRRTGFRALVDQGGEAAPVAAARALQDSSLLVRLMAVEYLAAVRPPTEQVLALLQQASDDADDKIRVIATRATWPFYRNAISLRDQQNTDRDVVVAQSIPLPREGWKFRLDPQRSGHREGWIEPDFNDADWDTIAIEQAWQQAGYEFIGVAWYRRTVELSAQPDCLGADMVFGGVDEAAWVWINGVYVGDHDIGPQGWDDPFRLDVTELLHWGQPNQITIRAMNTAHAGGIWKPVGIEVLK